MSKLSIILILFGVFTITTIIFAGDLLNIVFPKSTPNKVATSLTTPTLIPIPSPTPLVLDSMFNTDVPFVVQAPLGEWSDPLQQDACEEASLLMAIAWAKGEPVGTPSDQKAKILAIADYETQNFGESRDTGTKDALTRIAKGYFNFPNIGLQENITAQDIIEELNKGNLVITPMNGQALNNPHFTAPGPERHMLLVIGYDKATNEFITNDPGISQGKDYRYPVDVFENAIRDYPTGYHVPIEGVKKNMLVIQK